MNKEKKIYRLLFLVSVFLLLFNDLYLKYEFHNYLTGKLSDFAGLFAFPYFFGCFFPKRTKAIYIFSALLFVFWKVELSQPLFDFAHVYGFGFDRTVDYYDLFALLILPLSYHYLNSDFRVILKPKRIFKPIVIAICCFAFIATSQPRKSVPYDYKSDFETSIQMNIDSAKSKLHLYGSYPENSYGYEIHIPERSMSIETKIELAELEDGQLKIKLDSILSYNIAGDSNIFFTTYDREDMEFADNLSALDIEKMFEGQLKKQLGGKYP